MTADSRMEAEPRDLAWKTLRVEFPARGGTFCLGLAGSDGERYSVSRASSHQKRRKNRYVDICKIRRKTRGKEKGRGRIEPGARRFQQFDPIFLGHVTDSTTCITLCGVFHHHSHYKFANISIMHPGAASSQSWRLHCSHYPQRPCPNWTLGRLVDKLPVRALPDDKRLHRAHQATWYSCPEGSKIF
jgi:hypothetical protein